MDALILSCSTGGGHNSAASAVKEELELRGHNAIMMDPYSLAGIPLDKLVGESYIKIAQKTPKLFGCIYKAGDAYRKLPIHSPLYEINRAMKGRMGAYLSQHHFDVILMTHPFPGEILAALRDDGYRIPPTIYISTDYVCVPFTEEICCDYYVTPSQKLNEDFLSHGIPEEKLYPAGIPTKRVFREPIRKEDAKRALFLDPDTHYFLLSGGSIGGGKIGKVIRAVDRYMQKCEAQGAGVYHLIVITGNNEDLRERLERKYGGNIANRRITLLGSTDQMMLYMKACDAYLSKPGGLSSTEAAVSGTPLIHISPIPGCETKNLEFFRENGMSIAVGDRIERLPAALDKISRPCFAAQMQKNQSAVIPASAASSICDLAEHAAGL